MTQEVSQTETREVLLAAFDLLEGTSASTRAKTAETFLELLGARVRNPHTRSAYRVGWRSFLAFCSARQLELENVKAYHVGAWLDQHPGSRSTQRQHLAAVRLFFDSLMMRGVVEYNPAARARPPRLVRESSQTPVFEEAEIVAFLDSISLESLKDIRDKAIFSVLFYSWCRVSALIGLTVADYYERGGTRWLRFQEKRGKEHEVPVYSKESAKKSGVESYRRGKSATVPFNRLILRASSTRSTGRGPWTPDPRLFGSPGIPLRD